MLGRVSNSERAELLSRAHVLVATSVREGWGLTVSEAAVCGTPSIGYAVPGLVDSVPASGGALVDPNPDALGDALVRFFDGALRLTPRASTRPWSEVAEAVERRLSRSRHCLAAQPPGETTDEKHEPKPHAGRVPGRVNGCGDRERNGLEVATSPEQRKTTGREPESDDRHRHEGSATKGRERPDQAGRIEDHDLSEVARLATAMAVDKYDAPVKRVAHERPQPGTRGIGRRIARRDMDRRSICDPANERRVVVRIAHIREPALERVERRDQQFTGCEEAVVPFGKRSKSAAPKLVVRGLSK